MSIRLITIYHESNNAARNGEIEYCLQQNHAVFDQMRVISELADRPEWFHGQWFVIARRQVYSDLLDVAGDAAPGDVIVLANSDVLFTRRTLQLIAATITHEDAYCLSRWDFTGDGIRLFDRADSQDAWVFRGKPAKIDEANYPLGVPGCDNRFAYDLKRAGYKLSNPSKSAHIYHVHFTQYRPSNTIANRVAAPYVYVVPSHLGEPAQIIETTRQSKHPSVFHK